jgi:alkanesulfonate monooxygenase SsuD/methylene tetrahydromethanopterin reductase-like flavin-dependent oxidoreductase (luciferase family)
MRFGLFYLPTCEGDTNVARLYEQILEQCAYADELGIEAVWFAEHHFSRIGICPDPWTLAAAAAQRTRRLRLGSAVSILPFRNPLLIAEQVAMVDQLSNGRVELGVGRGAQPSEFFGFGAVPAESRGRLQESVAIIRQAWTEPAVTFQGEYFQYDQVEVWPKPVQRPSPPIWVAAANAGSVPWIAGQGLQMMATAAVKPLAIMREQFEAYQAAWATSGQHPARLEFPLNVTLHLADSNAQARREVVDALQFFFSERSRLNSQLAAATGGALSSSVNYELTPEQFVQDNALVGDPNRVIERIRRLEAGAGLTYVLGHVYPEAGHQAMMKMIRLLAEEVMPAFAGDAVGAAEG